MQRNYGLKAAFYRYIAPKMEPRIWNKPRIWNTFAADRVLFHSMRGFTVRKAFTLLEVAISGTPPPLLTASPPPSSGQIFSDMQWTFHLRGLWQEIQYKFLKTEFIVYSERSNTIWDIMFLGSTSFDFCGISRAKVGLIMHQKMVKKFSCIVDLEQCDSQCNSQL